MTFKHLVAMLAVSLVACTSVDPTHQEGLVNPPSAPVEIVKTVSTVPVMPVLKKARAPRTKKNALGADNLIVVSNNGSDSNQGTFTSPLATIAKANAIASVLIANADTNISIIQTPGVWSENVEIVPFVSYAGIDPGNYPVWNGNVSYNATLFQQYASANPYVSFSNILFENFNLDDTAFGGADTLFYIINCEFDNPVSFTSTGTETANWSEIDFLPGNILVYPFTLNNASIRSTASEFRGLITMNATNGHSAYTLSRGGNNYELGVVVNGSSSGYALWWQLGSVDGIGPVSLNGTNATFYQANIGSIPSSIILDGGAVMPSYLGTLPLSNLGPYTPANPANWAGSPPTSVSNALDRLSAVIAPVP